MPEVMTRLHELAACLTASIGDIATARGVTLTSLESQVGGDSDQQRVSINFTIAGDAPAQQLRQIVEQSRVRSAVYDRLAKTVPVDVTVTTRWPS
jgi:uncharacterized OsmC-like protein